MKILIRDRGRSRRWFAFLLTIMMLLATLPVTARAATEYTVDGTEGSITQLRADLAGLTDADTYTATFTGSAVLTEPLRISGGIVTFTAENDDNITITWDGDPDERHIIQGDNDHNYLDLAIQNITFDGGGKGGGIEVISGSLTMENVVMKNCVSEGNGGALSVLAVQSCTLLESCEFTGNKAVNGGAIFNMCELFMTSCKVNNNTATGNFGGGIFADFLNFTGGEINNNIVEGNGANHTQRPQGAGAYVIGDANLDAGEHTLTVSRNNFKNTAGLGAGIYATEMSINGYGYALNGYEHTVFSDNGIADGEHAGASAGGAVYVAGTTGGNRTLTIEHASFKNNYASQFGGAVASFDNILYIYDAYFRSNTASNNAGTGDSFYSGGGALYSSRSPAAGPAPRALPPTGVLNTITDTEFSENAADRGGAVFLDHMGDDNAQDVELRYEDPGPQSGDVRFSGVTFTDNIANDGGGIYLANTSDTKLYIGYAPFEDYNQDNAEPVNSFSMNTAAIDGGAIWADPGKKDDNLPRVYVGSETAFNDNSSGRLQGMTDGLPAYEDDISLHEEMIYAAIFTDGEEYAYNNHDIAYWNDEAITYTITYTANGGEGADVDGGPYAYNEYAEIAENPFTRAGYTFTGWNTQPEGGGDAYAPGGEVLVTGDMTLFAQWKQNSSPPSTSKYSVTYHANTGKGTLSDPNSPYERSASVTVLDPGKSITKSGYRFTGWNTLANGKGKSYQPGESFTITANTSLYAQWEEAVEYTVTYHPNGGVGTLEDANSPYPAGTDVTVLSPAGKITRSGYGFVEWNTKADGTGTAYRAGSVFKIDGDVALYARWRQYSDPTNPGTDIPDPIPPTGEWELNLGDHYAYIQGYPDGAVHPVGLITREETATIFFRLLTETCRDKLLTRENSFADVSDGRWSNAAISSLASCGIIAGYPNGEFAPSGQITRAEFAAIASRFDDNDIDVHVVFTDTAGHWAEDEISRAASLGWVRGNPDGSFGPDEYITRGEVAAMVNRMLLRLVKDESCLLEDMKAWPDNQDTSAWYYLDIQEASNSHGFERIEDTVYEKWVELMDDYDWSEYEKTSRAASSGELKAAPGYTGLPSGEDTVYAVAMSSYSRKKTTLMPAIDYISTAEEADDENGIAAYAGEITGTGTPGAEITLILPGGKIMTGIVDSSGKWRFEVDIEYISENHGNFVGAVQRVSGEKESAMATRVLNCITAVRIYTPVDENIIQGSSTPGALIILNSYSQACATVAEGGNWSVTVSSGSSNYYYDVYALKPGCVIAFDEIYVESGM